MEKGGKNKEKIVSKQVNEHNIMEIVISNIKEESANQFRRILCGDVSSYAIDKLVINQNDNFLTFGNSDISHRIGLIPVIKSELPKKYKTSQDSYVCRLDVTAEEDNFEVLSD